MNHSPTIALVILNWNGLELLKEFMPSVVSNSSEIPGCRIYVADNASDDGSLAYIKETYGSGVSIILNDGNHGYAKGYNIALQELEEDYFILLNSDVEVTPNWIQPIIDTMEADASIAACQPKLLSYKNKECFEYAGAAGGYMDIFGYPFCRGRMFNNFERDDGQYEESEEIFWASGAALFIRSKLFKLAGGFDEDFFAHMEEIDLCWRLQRMGYRIMAVPKSVIYHLGGGTLQKMNPRKTYLNFRNNRLMVTKNIDRKYLISNWAMRNMMDVLAFFQAVAYGNLKESLAILKALIDYHLLLPRWIKKRKELKVFIESSGGETLSDLHLYKRSIVFLYFVKGIRKFSNLP